MERATPTVEVAADIVDDRPRRCGLPAWDIDVTDERLYCEGVHHIRGRRDFVGTCPAVEADRVKAKVAAERQRLRGLISVVELCGSGSGFRGFDVTRHPTAKIAYDAVADFGRQAVAGGSPRLLIQGDTGLGKTRLLLASHLGLLERGVHSRFVTARELHELGQRADSKFTEAQDEANAVVDSILKARALHLDDLGEIEGDTRARGSVASAIKHIVSTFSGALAVTTNRTSEGVEQHTSLGGTVLSRLLAATKVVRMEGPTDCPDYRASTAVRV